MNRLFIILAVFVSCVYGSMSPSQIQMVKMSSPDNRAKHSLKEISKPAYATSLKAPKDAYKALAEKGAYSAKMKSSKILHQSMLAGAYMGFAGLLSLCIAGNLGGIGAENPGLVKMAFAALFPVNLLLIKTSGAQHFTGNSCAVAAAKYEGLIEWSDLRKNWTFTLLGNIIGGVVFALASSYIGVLNGGAAELLAYTAKKKCGSTFGQTLVKGILCNWLSCFAVYLTGATTDLTGKLVAVWFPVSTYVAIGLEHGVANLFFLPLALMQKVPLTLGDIVQRNLIPVLLGNIIAGAFVFAGSYSYQYGRLGQKSPKAFVEIMQQADDKWGIWPAKPKVKGY